MLIKIGLNEPTIGKHLSDMFSIHNGLKQGDDGTLLLLKFVLIYAIRKVQETKMRLQLNGTHQLLVRAHFVNLLGDNINTEGRRRISYLVLVTVKLECQYIITKM
jgi:hypothetical protein